MATISLILGTLLPVSSPISLTARLLSYLDLICFVIRILLPLPFPRTLPASALFLHTWHILPRSFLYQLRHSSPVPFLLIRVLSAFSLLETLQTCLFPARAHASLAHLQTQFIRYFFRLFCVAVTASEFFSLGSRLVPILDGFVKARGPDMRRRDWAGNLLLDFGVVVAVVLCFMPSVVLVGFGADHMLGAGKMLTEKAGVRRKVKIEN